MLSRDVPAARLPKTRTVARTVQLPAVANVERGRSGLPGPLRF